MSRNVNVPDDAIVIVLTPKQAETFKAWLTDVYDGRPSTGGYRASRPFPLSLRAKFLGAGITPES